MAALMSSDPMGRTQYSVIARDDMRNGEKNGNGEMNGNGEKKGNGKK